jgi:hypothetical protein
LFKKRNILLGKKNKKQMHIELSKIKGITALAEVLKAFNECIAYSVWDSEFDILKPEKNAKGNRMFTPEDITNLVNLSLAKERGLP